ncbi:uncharacterized protein LOC144167500 [Haemaphysalis longicornis]
MNAIVIALCVLTAVAAAPSTNNFLDEDGVAFNDLLDASSKSIGEEALQLSMILKEVAAELAKDEELRDETDEYFLNFLVEKAKNFTVKAGQSVKKVADSALKDAKCRFYEFLVTSQIGSAKKALGMITSTIEKQVAGGSGDVLPGVISKILSVANRLSQQGKQLTEG